MYKVTLTADEFNDMDFFVCRGYFPREIMNECTEVWNADKTEITLHIPEHIAWCLPIARENLDEDLYTCMSDTLKDKWLALEDEIV